MRSLFLIAVALMSPFAASAFGPEETYPDVEHSTPLNNTQLTAAFKGQTHLGSYNFLYKNITTYAFKETTFGDGSLKHTQQGKSDSGNWDITDNTICYDYDEPDILQACFKIYLQGNCYYHYVISTEGVPRFGFTARTVIAGETANCEPSFV